jgi:hypothetical protein
MYILYWQEENHVSSNSQLHYSEETSVLFI